MSIGPRAYVHTSGLADADTQHATEIHKHRCQKCAGHSRLKSGVGSVARAQRRPPAAQQLPNIIYVENLVVTATQRRCTADAAIAMMHTWATSRGRRRPATRPPSSSVSRTACVRQIRALDGVKRCGGKNRREDKSLPSHAWQLRHTHGTTPKKHPTFVLVSQPAGSSLTQRIVVVGTNSKISASEFSRALLSSLMIMFALG